jgi:hypothetical protein
MSIPLLSDAEQAVVSRRVEVIIKFIEKRGWSLDEALRVVAGWIYWTPKAFRPQVIEWLTELLVDLKSTNPAPAARPRRKH